MMTILRWSFAGDILAQTEGFEFSLLDIGGGFPGEVVTATTPAADAGIAAAADDTQQVYAQYISLIRAAHQTASV